MKDRIKLVRKEKGFTQASFAKNLKLSENYIFLMERGDREPSDRTISDICKLCSCNEDWLRTGKGDPFPPLSVKEQIAAFFGQIEGDSPEAEASRELIEALAKMPPEFRVQFRDYCMEVAKAHSRGK